MSDFNRRELLQAGLALGAGGLVAPHLARAESKPDAAAAAALDLPYKVAEFVGDNPTACHDFRDGKLKADPTPSEEHEVVVVGGGLTGLTAAFKLRHTDLLLLESAAELGGNAKAHTAYGQTFNIGAAYFVDVEGEQGQLLHDAGVDIRMVPLPQDAWLFKDKFYYDPWHNPSTDALLPSGFARALGSLRKIFSELGDSPDYPMTDYTKSTAAALKLDELSFAEWLKPYADPDLMPFLEGYCYSAMGGAPEEVSAYAALNFAVEFCTRVYAAPEGNTHLVRALAKKIDEAGTGRMRTGCTIYRVTNTAGGKVTVAYVKDGESRAVTARHVVLATPYFLSGRLIEGLAAEQRAALNTADYAAYIVGNLAFDGLPAFGTFDHWVPHKAVFDDFIPAAWTKTPAEKKQETTQIVAAFAPARRHRLARWKMLNEPAAAYAQQIVADFERVVPGATKRLKEVFVSRWGHGILLSRPGTIGRWLKVIKGRYGAIHLAHSDSLGLPAVEAATHQGIVVAQRILDEWQKKDG